jgi:hypothetical protein
LPPKQKGTTSRSERPSRRSFIADPEISFRRDHSAAAR